MVCYVLFERSKSTKKTGANRQIRETAFLYYFGCLGMLSRCVMPLAFYLIFALATSQASLQVAISNITQFPCGNQPIIQNITQQTFFNRTHSVGGGVVCYPLTRRRIKDEPLPRIFYKYRTYPLVGCERYLNPPVCGSFLVLLSIQKNNTNLDLCCRSRRHRVRWCRVLGLRSTLRLHVLPLRLVRCARQVSPRRARWRGLRG